MPDDRPGPNLPDSWLKKTEGREYAANTMDAEVTRLMLATKGGDGQAFDTLVRKLRTRAFQIAHSLVGSREDALDLAQETFMKVFRARSTFREGDPFLPWFHRILRNTCFSFLRKRGRLRKISISAGRGQGGEDEGDWELVDDGPPPSDRMEREECASAFHEAMKFLSARDREILILRHYRELSYKEIAESLGIPQGTVMSRLFHARRRLRERLENQLEKMTVPTGEPAGGPPEKNKKK